MERHNIIRKWSERNRPNPAYASLRDEGYRGVVVMEGDSEIDVLVLKPVPRFFTDTQAVGLDVQEKLVGKAKLVGAGYFCHVLGLLLDRPLLVDTPDYHLCPDIYLRPKECLPELEKCKSALTLVGTQPRLRDVTRDIVDYTIAQSGLPEMPPRSRYCSNYKNYYYDLFNGDSDFNRQCEILESEMKGGSKNNEL